MLKKTILLRLILGFNGVSMNGNHHNNHQPPQNNNTFVTDSNFSSVFGNTEPVGMYSFCMVIF